MTASGSVESIRLTNSLFDKSPGVIAFFSIAASRLSSRKSPFRDALSGPWQAKQ